MQLDLLLLLNLISTSVLVGVILVIHFVHYKTFIFIDKSYFEEFHISHIKSISYIVVPLMLVEIIVAFFLFVGIQMGMIFEEWHRVLILVNLICVISVWAVTFFLCVPAHNELSSGKNNALIFKLIEANKARVILWAVKLVVSIILCINF